MTRSPPKSLTAKKMCKKINDHIVNAKILKWTYTDGFKMEEAELCSSGALYVGKPRYV